VWLDGACPTPPHGGLAVHVLAPFVEEVRRECQPHRVPADLLHLDPCCWRKSIMANYFLVALIGTARSWLMNLPEGPSPPRRSYAISSWPTLRAPMLARAMRSTSTPCNNALGSHCGPSSSGSPRFKTPSLASPMLLLLSLFDRA
jgi:hypothetical protein